MGLDVGAEGGNGGQGDGRESVAGTWSPAARLGPAGVKVMWGGGEFGAGAQSSAAGGQSQPPHVQSLLPTAPGLKPKAQVPAPPGKRGTHTGRLQCL